MKTIVYLLTCATVLGLNTPAYTQEEVNTSAAHIKPFIERIWESNPTLKAYKARVLAAKAETKAASKWQYNPEVSFEMEDVDGEKKTNILGLSQTLDWSGKFVSSGKEAKFKLQATQAKFEKLRQDTALNVMASLVYFSATKSISELALERSFLMERFASLAQKRFKAGDIDQGEYNLAQLAFSEALIEQADVEATLAESKQVLASSIGFIIEDEEGYPIFSNAVPTMPSGLDENTLLVNLPDILAIRSRESAAKVAITGARKNRLPDPTFSFTGGKNAGADTVGFGVSIPFNIFNTYGAEVEKAKQEFIAESYAVKNALYDAKTRLYAAKRSYELSRKAWLNWQKTGASALAEQVDILDRKFKVGDLSATDYLVQIEQALDTQVAAKELYSKVWQSWFAWLGASGTINQWLQNSGEKI